MKILNKTLKHLAEWEDKDKLSFDELLSKFDKKTKIRKFKVFIEAGHYHLVYTSINLPKNVMDLQMLSYLKENHPNNTEIYIPPEPELIEPWFSEFFNFKSLESSIKLKQDYIVVEGLIMKPASLRVLYFDMSEFRDQLDPDLLQDTETPLLMVTQSLYESGCIKIYENQLS